MEQFLHIYPKGRIKRTIALLFPSRRTFGLSSLGYQHVFHLLSLEKEIHCERAFIETPGERILTYESGRGLESFDAVLISISFEGDLPGLVQSLAASGISLDRKNGKRPFIGIGGIGTVILPRYLSRFADGIFHGDAEAMLPAFIAAFLKHTDADSINGELASTRGYTPGGQDLPAVLPYEIHEEERTGAAMQSVILSDEAEFGRTGLIAVSKSCRFRCGFCLVSNAYGTYAPEPLDSILEAAGHFKGLTDRIGLVAATFTNHPQYREIIRELNREGFMLSFSAFRIEDLDEDTLRAIVDNENKTLVIAPETASDRLKAVIHKRIPNDLVISTARRAAGMGIKRLKLYFLIGLPGETEADLEEMVKLISEIRAASSEFAKNFGYIPELIVDINPLVPKPLTALADAPMEDIKSLKKKILYLKTRLRPLGRVFVYGESPRNAWLQYKIANGKMDYEELFLTGEG